MLREIFSATDIDLVLFLYKGPKRSVEIADFLKVDQKAVAVYMKRIVDKGTVLNTTEGVYRDAFYKLTEKGVEIANSMKSMLT